MKQKPPEIVKLYVPDKRQLSLPELLEKLKQISEIRKCSFCGCNINALKEFTELAEANNEKEQAEEARQIGTKIEKQKKYDCLGCNPCEPARLSNLLFEMGHDAIRKIKENLFAGYQFIYDADLSKYFDTIPHDKLMKVVSGRLADKGILNLIRQWLRSPVQQPDGQLEKSRIGTPQGGVISPLLANIYLNVFDQLVNDPDGAYAKEDIRIVRYADDCAPRSCTKDESLASRSRCTGIGFKPP